MGFSGELSTMSLPDVLQWIAQSSKTGTLLIDNGECTRRFEIDTGSVTGISSSKAPALLGLSLVEQGLITSSLLQHAVNLQKKEASESLLGRVLVDLGAIEPSAVERTLKEKIQENVLELLESPKGGFQFVEHEASTKQRVPVRFNINDLLLTSATVLDEARAGRTGTEAETSGSPTHEPSSSEAIIAPEPPVKASPPSRRDPTPILSQAVKDQGVADDPGFGPILLKGGRKRAPAPKPAPRIGLPRLAMISGALAAAGLGAWWASSSTGDTSEALSEVASDAPTDDRSGGSAIPSGSPRRGERRQAMGGTGSNAPSAATREGSNASSLPETGNADELEGAPQDGSASSGEFDESGLAETTTSSGDQPPGEPASSSTPPVASGANINSRDELINSAPPRTSGSPQPSMDTAPAPIAPVLVVPPEIKYPERALRRGEEAVVLLRVKVDTAGRVVDAEGAPRQDVPDEFLKAAIAAAFGARYQPATLDGKPIEFWTPLRIAFELK